MTHFFLPSASMTILLFAAATLTNACGGSVQEAPADSSQTGGGGSLPTKPSGPRRTGGIIVSSVTSDPGYSAGGNVTNPPGTFGGAIAYSTAIGGSSSVFATDGAGSVDSTSQGGRTATPIASSGSSGLIGDGGRTSIGTGGARYATTTPIASGGAAVSASPRCFDFIESTEGWKKNYAMVHALTDKMQRDEAASDQLLVATVVDWLPGPGYGNEPGFVQLNIPFCDTQSDYQSFGYAFRPSPTPLDLRNKTVSAFVKLVKGMTMDDPSNPSGATLYVKSGADNFYGDGGWNNLLKNEWTKVSVNVNSMSLEESNDPALFEPDQIVEIGIQLDTSGSATTVGTPASVLIDHVCYQ